MPSTREVHIVRCQRLAALVFCLMTLGVHGSNASAPAVDHWPMEDDGSLRFQATYPCGDAQQCRVSRVIVQEPNYDGPPGYTALLVMSRPVVGPGARQEELVVFTRGQIRLLGVNPETHEVSTFRIAQRGATLRIVQLVHFAPSSPQGIAVGPEGSYQYVSCHETGRHCILVDDDVALVSLPSGDIRRLQTADPIPHDAADPPRQTERGFEIGGGHRLDGEFMEMIWQGESGTLRFREAEGWREIEIDVAPELPK